MADASEKAGRMPRRVVLISDLQQGSRLDALGDFEWPSDVELDLKTVADDGSNAGLAAARRTGRGRAAADGGASDLRVRVSNDADFATETFELVWVDEQGTARRAGRRLRPARARAASCACPGPPATAPQRSLGSRATRTAFDNTLYFATSARSGDRPLRRRRRADDPDRPALLPRARLPRHAAPDA